MFLLAIAPVFTMAAVKVRIAALAPASTGTPAVPTNYTFLHKPSVFLRMRMVPAPVFTMAAVKVRIAALAPASTGTPTVAILC